MKDTFVAVPFSLFHSTFLHNPITSIFLPTKPARGGICNKSAYTIKKLGLPQKCPSFCDSPFYKEK